ncbi:MAG TPA: acyl-CoA dehydrogenase family protein [Acidimicrobiales bacterium]|nr:acyl-CoA dehydrogenase family protein [Acidimicrobiales bacterium]
MTTPEGIPEAELEYLAVAEHAVRTSGGADALDALGWWDLLPQLDDPDLRAAVFALFRAQGRQMAGSAALGGLLAQPYLDGTAITTGTVVATVRRESPRRGPVHLVVGEVDDGRQLLLDRPGHGAAVVGLDAVGLRPLGRPGGLPLHEVEIDWSRSTPTIDEPRAAIGRARSTFLGQVALALEILGAAETAVDLAIDHATQREQFGEPIGRFQAVRHLLAWARTDCVAVDAVTRKAVALDTASPPRYGDVVKAIAGRNGRRACERALQVLGGIGFTAEHDHHHHHSRVLALDALLGTSADLTHDLGRWLRTGGTDPGYATAVLVPAAR